jgi:hypothetical protein
MMLTYRHRNTDELVMYLFLVNMPHDVNL